MVHIEGIGDVDIETMAKEHKIPLSKIKSHLGLEPADIAEAWTNYDQAQTADALEKWLSFCRTGADFAKYNNHCFRTEDREVILPRWNQISATELRAAQTVDELIAAISHAPKVSELLSEASSRLVALCETPAQCAKAAKCEHFSEGVALGEKWASLCRSTNDCAGAYRYLQSRRIDLKEFMAKWIDLCTTAEHCSQLPSWHDLDTATLAKKWSELCQTEEHIRIAYRFFSGRLEHAPAIVMLMIGVCKDKKELGKVKKDIGRHPASNVEKAYIRKLASFYATPA